MLQFTEAGFDCAALIGPMGAWCGYVRVPKGHPWHGKDYNDVVDVPQSILERDISIDKIGAINMLCGANDVDFEAKRAPIVLAIDVHGGITYAGHGVVGLKDKAAWWFGFDCAHSGDMVPGMPGLDGEVRGEAFVTEECRSLARQLAAFQQEPETC